MIVFEKQQLEGRKIKQYRFLKSPWTIEATQQDFTCSRGAGIFSIRIIKVLCCLKVNQQLEVKIVYDNEVLIFEPSYNFKWWNLCSYVSSKIWTKFKYFDVQMFLDFWNGKNSCTKLNLKFLFLFQKCIQILCPEISYNFDSGTILTCSQNS